MKYVAYSYEYGDKTLPPIKDLVSSVPDPEKEKILKYLATNCCAITPKRYIDEISPDKTIGRGYLYHDGSYAWRDCLANYIDRYNIPVPEEFRNHILSNYDKRMSRHELLRSITCVEIYNKPCPDFECTVKMYTQGVTRYKSGSKDWENIFLTPGDVSYILAPIMTDLFCYDRGVHGDNQDESYYWKLTFYKGKNIADIIDGHPNEDEWRYRQIKSTLEFIESFYPRSLGYNFMERDT